MYLFKSKGQKNIREVLNIFLVNDGPKKTNKEKADFFIRCVYRKRDNTQLEVGIEWWKAFTAVNYSDSIMLAQIFECETGIYSSPFYNV